MFQHRYSITDYGLLALADNAAAELRILAERRLGEMLKVTPKNEGAKGTGSNQYAVQSPNGTAPPTLSSLGISKKLSSRAQLPANAICRNQRRIVFRH
jgi:hypothetical protein